MHGLIHTVASLSDSMYDVSMDKSPNRDKKGKTAKKPDPPKAEEKKPQLIPLPLIQDEQADAANEMEELFNEDKVTHEHGRTEPERD